MGVSIQPLIPSQGDVNREELQYIFLDPSPFPLSLLPFFPSLLLSYSPTVTSVTYLFPSQ